MKNADIIIYGDYVITMNKNMDLIKEGAIAISGNKIIKIAAAQEIKKDFSSKTIIEGKGKVLLPGLINTHTHAAMVYFRGLADDLLLKDWLENHMWPAENALLSPEFISDEIKLACLEMIKA
ncbi:MAG: amidohydrolase family protein, partial [Thermodesulfovibrionales bacterium]|nr:amidohydrolase family protein [Thermodesulfovibrionales bacterium]